MALKPALTHNWVVTVALAGLVAAAITPFSIQAAQAAETRADVAMQVLVLDDGSPTLNAVADRLADEGVSITRVDLTSGSRPQVTDAFLVTLDRNGAHGKFFGVVAPNEAPSQLSEAERSLLAAYEATFKVRQVNAYTWAHPEVGLNYAASPGYVGPVDGMRASVTDAGKADSFAYLNGVTLDDVSSSVDESWGYLAVPLAATETASFTPLVTTPIPGSDQAGSLIGAYTNNGREQLIVTFASNSSQNHWRALGHGIVSWLTRGVSTSYDRNYLSVHIDDVLLPDALWSIEGNCTIGDGCDPVTYPETAPGATSRMVASDVTRLVNWQQSSGIKLDMVYNGDGNAQQVAEAGSDALASALFANQRQLRWVNHTWSHPYLGCVQDFSTMPWQCAKDSRGRTLYASTTTIYNEVARNSTFSIGKFSNIDRDTLVTGEHSGLKTLPQMSVDNPNLKTALTLAGIRWVASDASREHDQRTLNSSITTVPRYPMNIFYNTETKQQATDEYNWIYTSAANSGSGACEQLTDIMTCIEPLDLDTGFDSYIVPIEARIAMSHVLNNDPRPHFAHQANLAADGVLYPVLDRLIDTYRQDFAADAPLVNLTMKQSGQELAKQDAWRHASTSITGVVSGNTVKLSNSSWSAITVPVTLPSGSQMGRANFGTSWGGQSSDWVRVTGLGSRTFTLPAQSGFATSVTWPVPPDAAKAPAGEPNPQLERKSGTVEVVRNEADSSVLDPFVTGP